jgi:RNA polymerase sigma-70 factor, ECF subfamily
MNQRAQDDELAHAEERALVDRARRGDRQAFERLLESKLAPVLRFGRTLCRDEQDALDVAQETLLTAYQKLADFRGESSLSSWLFVVARSICKRSRRKRAGEPQTFEPLDEALREADDLDPEELAELHRTSERLRLAIDTLSTRHREVLLLHDLQGLTTAEIGAILGLTIPATKSRIHRARQALTRELGLALRPNAGKKDRL